SGWDVRAILPRFSAENLARNLAIVEELARRAATYHLSPAQLAPAWLLATGPPVRPLPGTQRRRHLAEHRASTAPRLGHEGREAGGRRWRRSAPRCRGAPSRAHATGPTSWSASGGECRSGAEATIASGSPKGGAAIETGENHVCCVSVGCETARTVAALVTT